MTTAKQLYLFGLEGSASATFKIYPLDASDGKLRDWIELCGGTCLNSDEDGPYAIPILDMAWCKEHQIKHFRKANARDVFKSLFIYDCYTKEDMMDLNAFKISPQSSLPDYDANKILRRELSWDDLTGTSTRSHRPSRSEVQIRGNRRVRSKGTSTNSSICSANGIGNTEVQIRDNQRVCSRGRSRDPSICSANGTGNTEVQIRDNQRARSRGTSRDSSICSGNGTGSTRSRRKGAPYEEHESIKLLKYICDNDKHYLTGGIQMWKEMEDANVLEGRTYQSLKEHFRKKIHPNLKDYKCLDSDIRKFERAQKRRDGGRRRPQDAVIFSRKHY